MIRLFTPILLMAALFTNCKNHNPQPGHTVRDTTITKANAFSDLFLDSLTLEAFIIENELEDSAAKRIRNFYNSRNYQFAWFTEDGLAEQGRAFWNLHNNYVDISKDSSLINKQLHEAMENFIEEESVANDSKEIINTELLLTDHFFEYARYAYAGTIDPEELQWHIPRRKINPMLLLDSLIARKGQQVEQWEPVNNQYNLMRKELARYREIEQAANLEERIEISKILRYGDSASAIKQVKKRLNNFGDFASIDTSVVFTTELLEAVKQAQQRYGIAKDGVIGPAFMGNINVSLNERIEQVLINMERMRWMPKQTEGTRIVANIPEYKVYVYEGAEKVFAIDIVVGTSANKTVVFNDKIQYVVFSPYWNIPRSIVRNEILPAMRSNSNYLARKNMEQIGTSNGLPLVRQKPGGSNALGNVKFIFPNSYNIYFHDTPAKALFSKEARAFSHGCIRLAEPQKMAEFLLRNRSEWTRAKIKAAMNAGTEKWVTLDEPVPVLITYFTSWVDENGLLNFRDDIYGHDKKMAERLFVQQNEG